MERLERPSGRREASSTLSWKMSWGEWVPGAEPGVEESVGSNSPGDPGFRKGDIPASGLAEGEEAEEEGCSPDGGDGT